MSKSKTPATGPIPAHDPILDRLIAHAEAHANMAMRQNGMLSPVLFIDHQKTVGMLGVPPNMDEDTQKKDAFLLLARTLCVAVEARATVFVAEALCSFYPPDPNPNAKEAQPSEPPQEREAIVLSCESITGDIRFRMLPIIRSDNGTFFGFAPTEEHQTQEMSGRLAHILPGPVSESERAEAVALLAKAGCPLPMLKPGPAVWPFDSRPNKSPDQENDK